MIRITPAVTAERFFLKRALILTLTEAGALLLESLARSNDQQLAGAIIFMLTASIIGLNFFTDIMLAVLDPRVRRGIMGGA